MKRAGRFAFTVSESASDASQAGVEQWHIEAVIGALLLLNSSSFGYAPAGPWGDSGFSRGVGGLVGMVLLYRVWYLRTFGFRGLVPALRLWRDPAGSTRWVAVAAVITLLLAWLAGSPLADWMPKPAGLILTVIGLLMALVAGYAALSFGPLADDSEGVIFDSEE